MRLRKRKISMPADNIERAVKRGAGLELGAADYQTIMYEAMAQTVSPS